MVNLFFGAPAFVARLIPVHKLEVIFLCDQLIQLLHCIDNNGGFVYALMADNLRVNQEVFKLLHQMFQSLSIFSVVHPIPNVKFQALYCLCDPTHLFKNIRNNWVTEKTQTLDFFCLSTNQKLSASWKDLSTIYKSESGGSCLTNTKLDHQTLYPNNFEKQKVHLVVNVFNEKTCVALDQRKMYGTYKFVDNITKMWNILNSKKMDNNFVGHRMRGLTVDTSNALHQSLNGIVELVKPLLSCNDVILCKDSYILPGKIQSDRIEAEFGIYRQSSGGNYLISAEQVISNLQLKPLKLFSKLNVPFDDNTDNNSCCNQIDLQDSEEDLDCIERCFEEVSQLTIRQIFTVLHIRVCST